MPSKLPCYLSPEQAGSIDADVAEPSDLYAAGIVLFHCLAGRTPFTGDTVGTVLFEHMTTPVPELRSLTRAVPRALDELVQRLLRKDPRDRYQSAQAVLAEFNAIASALENGESDPQVVIGALRSGRPGSGSLGCPESRAAASRFRLSPAGCRPYRGTGRIGSLKNSARSIANSHRTSIN